MYTVYMHRNKINGKCYIGLTGKAPELRWLNGRGYDKQPFGKAIRKYGWDNFDHIILDENLTAHEAAEKEQYYIEYYNSYNKGYNVTKGGEIPEYKPIIFINKNIIYDDIFDAADQLNMTWSAIKDVCYYNMISKKFDEDGRYYCFDYYNPNNEYSVQKFIAEKAKNPIICLETKELFFNVTEVERIMGLYATNILKVCKHKYSESHGYHFMFYKEYLEKGEIYINTRKHSNKKIICITTNEIFSDVYQACKKYNLDTCTVIKCCENNSSYTYVGKINGRNLVWQYYDEYLIKPKDNNYNLPDNRKPVRCITTNKIFSSIREAGKYYNVDPTGIGNCCKKNGKQKRAGGYEWEYITCEDYFNAL